MGDSGVSRTHSRVLLSTVALEPNRWSPTRSSSIRVVDWIRRAVNDGFDGIELWENHYFAATQDDREVIARLVAESGLFLVFNCYNEFGPTAPATGVRRLEEVTAAIRSLQAGAVKFNVGKTWSARVDYLRNLREWLTTLPASCRPLCECHPGTILERPQDAETFFTELADPRVGYIVHPLDIRGTALDQWIATERVEHVHLQSREVPLKEHPNATTRILKMHRACPNASFSIEFCHTTARPGETPEAAYPAALADARTVRDLISPP